MLKPASEKPGSKGQAWFCTTGLPSDVIIEVADMTFHLHKVDFLQYFRSGVIGNTFTDFLFFLCLKNLDKTNFQFPLMSKSRKLHDMITEEEENQLRITKVQNPDESNKKIDSDNQEEEEDIEEDEDECHITLPDFPGGSESFETAAKFCYGVKIDLSAANAAALRCAAEYLQMTEEFSADNLISTTEIFLSQSVFKNIKHSVKTLSSCEKLLPMAEDLGIVWGCIEAIATKAAAVDPSLFGWPVSDEAVNNITAHEARVSAKFSKGGGGAGGDSWLDELWLLSLPILKRLIFAMKSSNLSTEIIESCLISYAKKYIPGISRTTKKPSSSSRFPTENEQRELLETIVSHLPVDKTSHSNLSSKTTRFFFGLLRTAYILNASDVCRSTLEKKIGSQLEHATLDDLLIPSYSYLNETLYDVDCVEKILRYFLQGIAERSVTRIGGEGESGNLRSAALILVGKLIDGYLSEVASDSNLKPEKFYDLAVVLPDRARIFDDGLYRAVDVYLKAHPWLSEAEREKICGVLDCQKLTLEACTHAAQNERLPLRAVVQVLFFEQLQLRHAIAGTNCIPVDAGTSAEVSRKSSDSGGILEDDASAITPEERRTWRAAVKENQVLRVRMNSMRTRVHELEREYCTMKATMEKIEKVDHEGHVERSGWLSKFGCKIKTQVCDSHERKAAETRKGRRHRPPTANN
ncbi:BTB/POZ domain-containing protein [Dorcoceras hygrometricum]|uniref:BTB/POZ domain-containing protein n=1 Tax=Dorcoceras hygrometricum TaxID=472368 RepID=A0A2Z7B152_9LAMI|nr:BTB/POZ domain-containing protein [Dorcoceras hygrometricum]